MSDTLRQVPRSWASNVVVGAVSLDSNVAVQRRNAAQGTITTTAGGEVLVTVPCTGLIASIRFVAKDALAKSDTNFVALGAINKQSGAGAVTVVDNTAAANTTKATGGNALAAYTPAILTLTANIAVNANDVLALSATVTGTLANQVTEGVWQITYSPS